MNALQKGMVMIMGIGLVTAMTLPDRQTPRVIDSFFNGWRNVLGTAITGRT